MLGSTSRDQDARREQPAHQAAATIVEVAHLHGGRARHHGEAVPQQQAERRARATVSELPSRPTTASATSTTRDRQPRR